MKKAFVVLLALCGFAAAQDANTAYVPFVVNVDATVTAAQGAASVSMDVTGGEIKTLAVPLGTTASLLNPSGARGQLTAPTVTGSRGNITLRLPPQSYNNAEIALFSVSGKRILRGKAAAPEAANAITRRNVAAGVYILSVKGTNGGAFTTRLTHNGGNMNINVAFGYESGRRLAKSAAAGYWNIKVASGGYKDTAYTLILMAGIEYQLQDITLIAENGGGGEGEDTFVDVRDNTPYKKVTIGTQTWMAENLNYAANDDGLYDWNTAMNACPAGWHLPSDAEWTTLVNSVGGACDAGRKLRSATGWAVGGNGTNEYGFSALPVYGSVGAGWWSATAGIDADYALSRGMGSDHDRLDRDRSNKTNGFSVRCVQDATGDGTPPIPPTTTAYTIRFNANSGTVRPASGTTGTGGTLSCLPTPTRNGYTFDGWYTAETGGSAVTAERVYTADTTIYAQWTAVTYTIYTITFNANSGTVSPTSGTTGEGGKLATLPTPTRNGYTFDGWYTAAMGGTAVTTDRVYAANTTIYAVWTAVTYTIYTITYELNGGTVSSANPTNYTAATATFTLRNPTKPGYVFTGWTGSNGATAQMNVSIQLGSTGDKSYTANWREITVDTFVDDRDGKTYKKVAIGNQVWMAENLNYNATGSVCYGNSDANCEQYGRLYVWATAMGGASSSSKNPSGVGGVCPGSWHLPSDAEWNVLVNYAGGSSPAGTKLKSKTGWNSVAGGAPASTDDYGFSALPGGYGNPDGSFYYVGYNGYWWSATEDDASYAWFRDMDCYGSGAYRNYNYKGNLFSVRCVQD